MVASATAAVPAASATVPDDGFERSLQQLPVGAGMVVLRGQLAEAAGGALRVGELSIADQCCAAVREMGFHGRPLLLLRVVECGETGAVLVVAADELDVIEGHPYVSGVQLLRFADYPVLAKLTRWGIDAHTGVLFGLVNQIALVAFASCLILLIVWGYRMWWQRGRGASFGRPLPRGAWQNVPAYVLVPLIATVGVLGYFVPRLGIPLAAFLAVDIGLGEIAYWRGERTYVPVG
ncbi:PepSY domain-containing protein [Streptomyces sp. NPDC002206]